MTRRRKHRHKHIFHIGRGTPYHVENSFRGIEHAARSGANEIDLDLQIDKNGVEQNTHWPRPLLHDGFYDPLRKIGKLRTVASMTSAEVARLRTRGPHPYHIRTLDQALAKCAQVGIAAKLEPKGDKRFKSTGRWLRIKGMAKRHGTRISVYALRRNAGALPYVTEAGIPNRRLGH